MSISFDLPAKVEQKLRAQIPDLDADVKRAYALALFRCGRITHSELSDVLGLDRFDTDALLKRHDILEGSLTSSDLEDDRSTIERVLGRAR